MTRVSLQNRTSFETYNDSLAKSPKLTESLREVVRCLPNLVHCFCFDVIIRLIIVTLKSRKPICDKEGYLAGSNLI